MSDDGLTYTFHLRPNVQFQTTDYFKPTRKLNADDVVFTFERMLSESNPWHKVAGASGFPHAQSMGLVKLIKSVSKVDDNTVKFELNEPNATFVPILTMGFASIYSAEYADQLLKANKQADLNVKPIGTGPFVLKSYTKDAVIRYEVNPDVLGREAEDRPADLRDHAGCFGARAEDQGGRMPDRAVAEAAGRHRGEERQVAESERNARVHDGVRRAEYAEETAR